MKKPSEKGDDNVTFRGCFINQSYGAADSPERAVQGPNEHHPIGAKRTTETTSEIGQTNQIDKTEDCATNHIMAEGQVTRLKEI